jgi:hypothetical protein
MGWFILVHVFTTWMSIVSIGRLSEQEKELEILVLRQQLAILQRKCDKPVKPSRIEKMTLAVLVAKLKQVAQRPTNQRNYPQLRGSQLGKLLLNRRIHLSDIIRFVSMCPRAL